MPTTDPVDLEAGGSTVDRRLLGRCWPHSQCRLEPGSYWIAMLTLCIGILVTPPPKGTSLSKSTYSSNTPIFLGQCTIKHVCMSATAMRRIATPKTRSDVGRKRRRQLPHASAAPV